MAISGITFENQLVTQKDDGTLYDWIIGRDGIITGCDLSYLGMDLTISPGYLCVAGRILKVETSETVTLGTEVINGYAQLKLIIDTSKLSTELNFEQVEFAWVYSATTTFPALTQEAINDNGTIYEFELCVLATTTGGITGVTRSANKLGGSRATKLWEGSWSSGSITVPGSEDYDEFNVVISASGIAIKVLRNTLASAAIFGISGSIPSAGTAVSTYHFACTVSGTTWTWQNAGSLNHNGGTTHGTVSIVSVTAVYGVR